MQDSKDKTFNEEIKDALCSFFLYATLILIAISGICLLLVKMTYHVYLNLFLILNTVAINKWEQSTNIIYIEQKINTLCSLHITSHVSLFDPRYDLTIVTDDCNVSAYCLNKLYTNISKVSYVHSYFNENCLHEQNVYEATEILTIIVFFGLVVCVMYSLLV